MLKDLKGQLSAPLSPDAMSWWWDEDEVEFELQEVDNLLLEAHGVRFYVDRHWPSGFQETHLECKETGVRLEISQHMYQLFRKEHCLPEHWNSEWDDGEGLRETPSKDAFQRPYQFPRRKRKGLRNPQPSSKRGWRRAVAKKESLQKMAKTEIYFEAVAEADRAYAIRTLRGSAATRPFEVSPLAVTFEWHQIQRAHLNIFADPDSGARIRSWAERTVSVDSWQWIAGKEGEVRNDLPGRWTATDVHGNRWVMFADNER